VIEIPDQIVTFLLMVALPSLMHFLEIRMLGNHMA
jgi:hypothetical protein